jgi:hypothetical protein
VRVAAARRARTRSPTDMSAPSASASRHCMFMRSLARWTRRRHADQEQPQKQLLSCQGVFCASTGKHFGKRLCPTAPSRCGRGQHLEEAELLVVRSAQKPEAMRTFGIADQGRRSAPERTSQTSIQSHSPTARWVQVPIPEPARHAPGLGAVHAVDGHAPSPLNFADRVSGLRAIDPIRRDVDAVAVTDSNLKPLDCGTLSADAHNAIPAAAAGGGERDPSSPGAVDPIDDFRAGRKRQCFLRRSDGHQCGSSEENRRQEKHDPSHSRHPFC